MFAQSRPWRLDLEAHVQHFRARVLQDALTEATAAYWERRAAMFEWARPRRGDFVGQATPAELADADARCAMIAENCRRHAKLLRSLYPEPISAEVWAVLREVGAA